MFKNISGLVAGLLVSAAVWANPTVEMTTSLGKITIELAADKAPKSVANFLQYAKEGFYNGTIFHRVIPGFMVQGGGFEPQMKQKTTRGEIENEGRNGLKNTRGTIAMARKGNPNSATAQFFINHSDNSGLDYPSPDGHGYAVFGKVTKGMDVVDQIARVQTASSGPFNDVPVTPVVIQTVKIISEK